MRVRASMDKMGWIQVVPINKRLAKAMERDARSNGAPKSFRAEIFLQTESDIMQFANDYTRIYEDIEQGFDRTYNMDEWEFRQLIGYAKG